MCPSTEGVKCTVLKAVWMRHKCFFNTVVSGEVRLRTHRGIGKTLKGSMLGREFNRKSWRGADICPCTWRPWRVGVEGDG